MSAQSPSSATATSCAATRSWRPGRSWSRSPPPGSCGQPGELAGQVPVAGADRAPAAGMQNPITSTSVSVERTRLSSRSPSSVRGRCRPGVSTMISWASGRCTMPRIARRVVCGRLLVIATFVPTSAFIRVDLPTLGRPAKQAKPERKAWPGDGSFTT